MSFAATADMREYTGDSMVYFRGACERIAYGDPGDFMVSDKHFTVLNQYYDGISDTGTDGDVTDALHDWLVADLTSTSKPVKFVFGHEPAFPQPDEESGRLRHEDDSLNAHETNRNRFWQTLVNHGVTAYICGHTHNYSMYQDNGVWQIDVGHARGFGDTGARSTFVMFYVIEDGSVWYYPYRLNLKSHNYERGTPGKIR